MILSICLLSAVVTGRGGGSLCVALLLSLDLSVSGVGCRRCSIDFTTTYLNPNPSWAAETSLI